MVSPTRIFFCARVIQMSREHINRVVRWHIGVIIAVLLVFTVGAVLMSTSPRSGLEKVHTVSDLENIPVVISYAAGDVIGARSTTDQLADYQKYHDQNVDIACHAQVVMIVTAQQEIELTTVSIGQKVRINQILQGNVSIQENEICTLWLPARIFAENDQIVFESIQNLMQPGKEYLVLLENTSLNEYHGNHDNFLFLNEGSIRMIPLPYHSLSPVPAERTNTYSEWEEYSYFTSVPEMAAEFDSICIGVLEYYQINSK